MVYAVIEMMEWEEVHRIEIARELLIDDEAGEKSQNKRPFDYRQLKKTF